MNPIIINRRIYSYYQSHDALKAFVIYSILALSVLSFITSLIFLTLYYYFGKEASAVIRKSKAISRLVPENRSLASSLIVEEEENLNDQSLFTSDQEENADCVDSIKGNENKQEYNLEYFSKSESREGSINIDFSQKNKNTQ